MYKQLLSTQQKHWNILKELNLFIFTQPRILSLVKPLQNESISHHLITYPPRTLNTFTASPTTHTTIAQLISPPLSHHHSHTIISIYSLSSELQPVHLLSLTKQDYVSHHRMPTHLRLHLIRRHVCWSVLPA